MDIIAVNLFSDMVIVFDPVELEKLLRGPNGHVAASMERMGIQAEGIAKVYCPVDTGALSTSITHVTEQDESGQICGYVGSDKDYAIYPEFGTEYQVAQPYLRPAVDEVVSSGGDLAGAAGWLS